MSVFVTDLDAFEKILSLEGQHWLREGAESSFKSVLRSWQDRDEDGWFDDSVIYGSSGMRRYIVDANGEVFYSVSHDRHSWSQAKNLGFRSC